MQELIRKLAQALGLAPRPRMIPLRVRVPARRPDDFLKGRK